jgi:hypothetical protein
MTRPLDAAADDPAGGRETADMTAPGFGVPPPPPGAQQSRRWVPQRLTAGDVLAALVVAIGLVVAGVPLGLLWAVTAPKVDVSAALAGNEATFNAQAGADVHFAFLALIFGAVAGALVGWRGRNGSWTLPLAVAIGSAAGSIVAAQIGHLTESSKVLDQLPQNVRGQVSTVVDFTLRSHGFIIVFPIAALVTYLIIVVATTRTRSPELPDAPEPERYWSVPR